ncbi:MAG: SIMPL domain-containing protein [Candidatus Eremiobacteraeota bacterium]|nr:SIMPL domain-containing protein [Candidatus Eremiobacteraeota bacterium]
MNRLLVPFVFCVAAVTGAAAAAQTTTISVVGNATVTMVPDQATVNASVITTASSASQAVSENNTRYDAIAAALVRIGIKRDDITLSYYNVNYVPRPNPMPENPSPYDRYGYTVTRSFAVKVRSIDRAGAVVDAATAAGATNIDGVSFGLADPDRARAQAARNAVSDARAKAEDLAKAAGLRIIGIRSIELEGAPGIVRPMVMAKEAATAQAPTVFDAGNVNVTANVNVVFSAAP